MMIELSASLTIFGLFLDIAGVVAVFRFGLPPMLDAEQRFIITKDGFKSALFFQEQGNIGLSLLIIGFLFQVAGNGVVLYSATH